MELTLFEICFQFDFLGLLWDIKLAFQTFEGHAVASLHLGPILRCRQSVGDHAKVSRASDCFQEAVGAFVLLGIDVEALESAGEVVEKAWSSEDFVARGSRSRGNLEAALDHLVQVGRELRWKSVIDASSHLVGQGLHALGSERW